MKRYSNIETSAPLMYHITVSMKVQETRVMQYLFISSEKYAFYSDTVFVSVMFNITDKIILKHCGNYYSQRHIGRELNK